MVRAVVQRLAMPMRGMKSSFVSKAQHVPAHFLTLFRDQPGKITEDESVDRIKEAGGLSCEFVIDHERCHEFLIDTFRGAIWICLSLRGDDDGAFQARIRLPRLIRVAVIPPHNRTQLAGPRTASRICKPVIGEMSAGGNASSN